MLRQQVLAWLVLAASVVLSILISNAVRLDIEEQAETRFAFAADQIVLRIEERLNAYALLLRGAAGIFVASDSVTRQDWKSYVDNLHLDKNLGGVQGIGFTRLITADNLSEHIAAIRAEGFVDYNITPAGERDVYSSIIYLEPFEGRNLRAFGYDMYSEPVRRAAMNRARDLDEASLSGRVELMQELDNEVQAGTLLYVPVYQANHATDTTEQRRAALIGWVYSPFRMSDLMTGLIGDWTRVDLSSVGLRIYDGRQKSPATLLFASTGLTAAPEQQQRQLSRVLAIHGHEWLLEFEQSAAYPDVNYEQAWRTLAAGLLLSLLLFSLLTSMSRTRNRAVAIANNLTRDIQLRETALRQAHAEAEQFREALDYVNSYIYIKDTERCYRYANKSTLELFNCTTERLVGATDAQFFPAETCAHLKDIDLKVLAGNKSRSEIIVRHPDGSRTVYLELKTPVYDDAGQGAIAGILGISTDITAIKDHEEQMERIAHYDALTTLPNRLLLGDRLRQGIAHVNRHGGKLAVVYLDLDGFKAVNDSHGHDVGDELLKVVAVRLREALRDGDTVARIGGDEFVAVLLDLENQAQIEPILQRMMHAAADPVYVHGLSLKVSASMGVSLYPQEITADSTEQPGEDGLLRQADQAMYQAKTAGKHRAHLFTGTNEVVVLTTDS